MPSEEPLHKRQKHDKQQRLEPRANQCQQFLASKNRRCKMQKRKNSDYCSEHAGLDNADVTGATEKGQHARMPCPLDPKHGVYVKDLQVHLKKCNARPVATHDPWYIQDINKQLQGAEEAEKSDQTDENGHGVESEPEALKRIFTVLEQYAATVQPLERKVHSHEGLDAWLRKKENRKHVTQQSSLVGAMKEADLLSPSHLYVEFGCGKAELSRMVNACVVHDCKEAETEKIGKTENLYGYALVDRGVNRMKSDSKIVTDCEGTPLQPQVKRSRIDIQHLDLDRCVASVSHESVVAISKHLCGAATDLTLKSILNSAESREQLSGAVVAMCCRHACDYEQFLPQSQAFLAENGVHRADFQTFKRIVTWAICGKREGKDDGHVSGLSFDERERMGLVARRMIDDSRVHAVNSLMPNHSAEVFLYADKETTKENNCLRITRKR